MQTTIIALIQALVIGFFLAGAATGSAAAMIGIGLLCLVFILITMWSGVKAVWNSFNRLFNAMGQVTGDVLLSPGSVTSAAVTGAAAVATGGAALATSMGSNALAGMNALNQRGDAGAGSRVDFWRLRSSLSGAARTLDPSARFARHRAGRGCRAVHRRRGHAPGGTEYPGRRARAGPMVGRDAAE